MNFAYDKYLEKQTKTPKKDFRLFAISTSTHIISIVSSVEKQQRIISELAAKGLDACKDFTADFLNLSYPLFILETYGEKRDRIYQYFQSSTELKSAAKALALKEYSIFTVEEDYLPKKIGDDCMGVMNHDHVGEDE